MCRRLVDNGYDLGNIVSWGLQIVIPIFRCFRAFRANLLAA